MAHERFFLAETQQIMSGFSQRLKQSFNNTSNAEIACSLNNMAQQLNLRRRHALLIAEMP
jgi:hypothetical protein